MGTFVQTQVKIYVDGYDFSGDMNGVALASGAEAKDSTTYGDDTRTMLGGLRTVSLTESGLWTGGAAKDKVWFDNVGVSNKPVSVMPTTGAAGEPAFFFNSMQSQYVPGEAVGEIFKFNVEAQSQDELVRGSVLFPLTTVTSTDVSTGQVLGAASATQKVYAALHVMSASGTSPTLDVVVQSDTSGFGSPTDQITFDQAATLGSQIKEVGPGAITDTYWRISYTIGGSATPTFSFAVMLGIQ